MYSLLCYISLLFTALFGYTSLYFAILRYILQEFPSGSVCDGERVLGYVLFTMLYFAFVYGFIWLFSLYFAILRYILLYFAIFCRSSPQVQYVTESVFLGDSPNMGQPSRITTKSAVRTYPRSVPLTMLYDILLHYCRLSLSYYTLWQAKFRTFFSHPHTFFCFLIDINTRGVCVDCPSRGPFIMFDKTCMPDKRMICKLRF